MKTNQPSYFCLANLGDASPLEYGGEFVLVDRRGIYDPQLWVYEPNEREGKPGTWTRFDLPQCFPCHGAEDFIGTNRFHPTMPEWFGTPSKLASVASSAGIETRDLVEWFCASDPIARAMGYSTLARHYGGHEFDHYPDTMDFKTDRKFCNLFLRQEKAAAKWHDGAGI